MNYCDTCGRSLVGLRADHPFHCRIGTALRSSAPVELVFDTGARDRALVTAPGMAEAAVEASRLEAEGMDPGPYRRRVQLLEGPVQRGITRVPFRRAS